ncbi:MAG: hypothetical protein PHY54_07340 [Methylococcales bacterium]|nr:hypothetical protein [Methylococcales bacterium]
MQTLNNGIVMQGLTGLLLLTTLTGCAEWNSHPVVVQQNYGNAVRNMVKNQTLYPEHGRNDNPILSLDGQKAEGVINAYRQPAGESLEKAKEGVTNFSPTSVGGTGN